MILLVTLNLSVVGLGILLSYWRNQWYTALQARDWPRFLHLLFAYANGPDGFMPGFVYIAALMVAVSVQSVWLRQWLQLEWRAWMTQIFLAEWRAARAHSTMVSHVEQTDNPDQRIADDIRFFTEDVLALSMDFITAAASAAGYIVILWRLSAPVAIGGLRIGGSMVFIALLYAAAGTWLTHLAGRNLAMLDARQQRREADFRFRLMGERSAAPATASADTEFSLVVANFRSVIGLSRIVRLLTRSYNQLADIFPLVVAAPRYFAGTITLGALLQTADSFGQMQSALSWFVNNYTDLADLRATIGRLETFRQSIDRRVRMESSV